MTARTLLLLPVAAVLTACGSGLPEVTFAAGGTSATVAPTQYCAIDLTGCENDPAAVATLAVPRGTSLRVTVPEEVGEAPWQVAFRYTVDGELRRGRTEVFAPGARSSYVLRVPEGGTLQTAEVQQYGAPGAADGERFFRIRASWVVSTP